MLKRMNLSYLASGTMVLWLVILFARLRLGNQLWQDIFQILVGVGFSLYGVALIRNWQGAGEYLIRGASHIDPRRYKLAGYLWLVGGIGVGIAAVMLIATGVH